MSKRGNHVAGNIVAACLHCNVSKGKHDWPITTPAGEIIVEELERRVANGFYSSGEHAGAFAVVVEEEQGELFQ